MTEAWGNGSSGRISMVAPVFRSFTDKPEHAVEGLLEPLEARAQPRPERVFLGPRVRGRRESGEDDGGGERADHAFFHTRSYLGMPVGPMARPWTLRRWTVKTETWNSGTHGMSRRNSAWACR